MGTKPGDEWCISLCHEHHAIQHSVGEPEFERRYRIVLTTLAAEFWARSPHRRKFVA